MNKYKYIYLIKRMDSKNKICLNHWYSIIILSPDEIIRNSVAEITQKAIMV